MLAMVAMMSFNATQQHLIACAKKGTWYQRHRHAHWTHAHWSHTGHVHGPHAHWGPHAHMHTQPHTHRRVWPHGSLVGLMLWWSFRLGHRTSPMSTSVDLDIKKLQFICMRAYSPQLCCKQCWYPAALLCRVQGACTQ